MNRPLLICLLFFYSAIVFSCKEESPKLSVQQESLIKILMDVHLAEAALQNYYGDNKDSLADHYYGQIYQFHNIEKEELSQNLEILRKNPAKLKSIYTIVVEELSKQETSSFKDKYNKKK